MGRRTLSKKLVKLAEIDVTRAQVRFDELSEELRHAEARVQKCEADLAAFQEEMGQRVTRGLNLGELLILEAEQTSLQHSVGEAEQARKNLERGVSNEKTRLLQARHGVDRAEKVSEKVEDQESKQRQRTIQRMEDDRAGRKGWEP